MTDHKSLAEALAAFQGETTTMKKEAEAKAGSFSYKYIDLADVVEGIREPMQKHGLSFSAFPCFAEGEPALRYTLRHASGDVESDVMPLMLSKQDAQGLGSAITYGRRYALCAVLNLVADADDDGHAAGAGGGRQQRATTQKLDAQTYRELRDLYARSGWTTETLHAYLKTCGVVGVDDLSSEQARKLRELLEAAIEEKAA